MIARDIMTSSVVTVSPDTTVADIVRLLLERDLSGVPVVDPSKRVVGIVTDIDLVERHMKVHLPTYLGILGTVLPIGTHRTDEEMRHILAVSASDLMTKEVVTIEPGATIDEVATLMVDRGVNPVPVVEAGELVGIISRADILRVVLSEESDTDAGRVS